MKDSIAQWKQTNGPGGGEIYNFAAVGNVLFTGTLYGGVYRSINNGITWNSIGLKGFFSFTFLSKDNYLFAGTERGIYRTSDQGSSWENINSGIGDMISGITCFASNGIKIYAGTSSGSLFVSSNNGDKWNAINGLSGRQLSKLDIRENILFATTYNSVFYSTNEGINWIASSGINSKSINCLYSNKNVFLAGTSNGIYSSTNNGINWSHTFNEVSSLDIYKIITKGNDIYAVAEYGIYRSTNSGLNWVNNNFWGATTIFANDSGLYAGTNSNGIYYTSDNGVNWTQRNTGLANKYVLCIAGNENIIFAGTHSDHIFFTTDKGDSWIKLDPGPYYVTSLAYSSTTLFAGNYFGYIYSSSNNGINWDILYATKTGVSISYLSVYGDTIIAGTSGNGIIRSNDKGKTWNSISSGFDQSFINCIVRKDNTLLAAAYEGILRSTDDGSTWQNVYRTTSWYYARYIIFNGSDILAGVDGKGLIKSDDNGISWKEIRSLDSWTVYNIAVQNNNIVVTNNYEGVSLSTNNGKSWTKKNMGFDSSSPYITSLFVQGQKVYIGTQFRSVMKCDLQELINSRQVSDDIPQIFAMYHNYPNPFNPYTKIDFSVLVSAHVKLRVFNSLGKEIKVLVNENLTPGNYEYEFNGESFSSGMYLYVLESNNTVITGKMILLK